MFEFNRLLVMEEIHLNEGEMFDTMEKENNSKTLMVMSSMLYGNFIRIFRGVCVTG